MKSEKGISYIALLIITIIILIISMVTVDLIRKKVQKEELNDIKTLILYVEAKVQNLQSSHQVNPETVIYRGIDLSKIEANETIKNFLDKGLISEEEYSKYYLLYKEDLIYFGVEEKYLNKTFIVNYEADEIVYVDGYTVNDITYYKLSDIKQLNDQGIKVVVKDAVVYNDVNSNEEK